MAVTLSAAAPLVRLDGLQPLLDWSGTCAALVAQNQRAQLELLDAWQRSIAALHRQWWDEWACRWAGGVPIDA
jgi:hypothetical protein